MLKLIFLFSFSLLSGRSDGSILLHQIKNISPSLTYQCKRLWKCGKHDKEGHRYSVECIRWFPNDTGLFVSAAFDKRLKIWDTSSMRCVETISYEGKIYNFDLSPAKRSDNCSVAGKYLIVFVNYKLRAYVTRGDFQILQS